MKPPGLAFKARYVKDRYFCTKCKKYKTLAQMAASSNRCRPCDNKRRMEWTRRNRARHNATVRRYKERRDAQIMLAIKESDKNMK